MKTKAPTFPQRNKDRFEKEGTLWALSFLTSALLKGAIVTSPAFCPPRSPLMGLPAEQVKGLADESCWREGRKGGQRKS